jgi:hypothetical protein
MVLFSRHEVSIITSPLAYDLCRRIFWFLLLGSFAMAADEAAVPTPEELFKASYNAFQWYPRQLLYKNCSEYSLKAYAETLKNREHDLFGPIDEAVIPMIDLKADRKGTL